MKLDIRIISMIGDTANVSGVRDVPNGTTANDLIAILKLPPEETYALLVNDMTVSLPDRDTFVLNDGDKVTVFPPIKGG